MATSQSAAAQSPSPDPVTELPLPTTVATASVPSTSYTAALPAPKLTDTVRKLVSTEDYIEWHDAVQYIFSV